MEERLPCVNGFVQRLGIVGVDIEAWGANVGDEVEPWAFPLRQGETGDPGRDSKSSDGNVECFDHVGSLLM